MSPSISGTSQLMHHLYGLRETLVRQPCDDTRAHQIRDTRLERMDHMMRFIGDRKVTALEEGQIVRGATKALQMIYLEPAPNRDGQTHRSIERSILRGEKPCPFSLASGASFFEKWEDATDAYQLKRKDNSRHAHGLQASVDLKHCHPLESGVLSSALKFYRQPESRVRRIQGEPDYGFWQELSIQGLIAYWDAPSYFSKTASIYDFGFVDAFHHSEPFVVVRRLQGNLSDLLLERQQEIIDRYSQTRPVPDSDSENILLGLGFMPLIDWERVEAARSPLAPNGRSGARTMRQWEGIIINIVRIFSEFHQNGICIRDVSLKNFMNDHHLNFSSIDTGSSLYASEITELTRVLGVFQPLPEAAAGLESDTFSLAFLLLHVLAGVTPAPTGMGIDVGHHYFLIEAFKRHSGLERKEDRFEHLRYDFSPLQRFIPCFLKALHDDPNQRYPNAIEFLRDLERQRRLPK